MLSGNCKRWKLSLKKFRRYHKLQPSSFINDVNFVSPSHDAGIQLFWWIILPRTVKSAYCVPLTATVKPYVSVWSSQAVFTITSSA